MQKNIDTFKKEVIEIKLQKFRRDQDDYAKSIERTWNKNSKKGQKAQSISDPPEKSPVSTSNMDTSYRWKFVDNYPKHHAGFLPQVLIKKSVTKKQRQKPQVWEEKLKKKQNI